MTDRLMQKAPAAPLAKNGYGQYLLSLLRSDACE